MYPKRRVVRRPRYGTASSSRFDGQGILNEHGNITVGGDLVINQSSSTANERRRKFHDSLKFDQMHARQMDIKGAHRETCQWFLQTPEYLDWADTEARHGRTPFLWIKGKPGAGKSTLMKFILSHTGRTTKGEILSFFFNARGGTLQRSTGGLYRSFLVQLLEHHSQLEIIFDSIPSCSEWSIESLQFCLGDAIRRLGEAPIICFVDALDECNEAEVREMVSFFNELANSSNTRLHVCFASRHYPNIRIKKAFTIILESRIEHDQDIIKYIDSKLDLEEAANSRLIRSELNRKASGVFVWIVLVINALNKEYDYGGKHNLLNRLDDIPGDLDTLFRNILNRPDDNINQLFLCIQWLLFARSPLTPAELYFAVISGTEPDKLALCHSDEISVTDMKMFILHSSRGLTELSKAKRPTVQFIHESVKNFLIKEDWLPVLGRHVGGGFQGQSHQILKQCCLAYIRGEPVSALARHSPTQDEELVARRFPFLEYAVRNVLYHADEAESNGISQKQFLENFSVHEWSRLYDLLTPKWDRTSEWYIQANDWPEYSPNVSLLYVLADNACPALIRSQPAGTSCFTLEDEEFGAPIFAAINSDSQDTVLALLEVMARGRPQGSPADQLWKQYKFFQPSFYPFRSDEGIIHNLAKRRDNALLELYLAMEDKGYDLNALDGAGNTPLSWAAKTDVQADLHADLHGLVQLLLEREAKIDKADSKGRTPLSWAAGNGNADTTRLLLESGAQVNFVDIGGRTPLSWAAGNGNADTALLLLDYGAQVNVADARGQTPLSYTVGSELRYGLGIVHALLEKGAHVDATDIDGRTPLFHAVSLGFRGLDVMQALLEKGANVDAADKDGLTPLLWVAKEAEWAIEDAIAILLEYGAHVEAADRGGRTPLSYAAGSVIRRGLSIAHTLLEKGAFIDAADADGRTPLFHAVGMAFQGPEIIQTLVEKGANVDAIDKDGLTPLRWAEKEAQWGIEDSIALLLKRGAHAGAAE